MARRKVKTSRHKVRLVEYADEEPSAFASMLGGLIEANVESRPEKQQDFQTLVAKVGIWVTDIKEGVTLDFQGGTLTVYTGLKPNRRLTIRTDAETVMNLSNLRIGFMGLPIESPNTTCGRHTVKPNPWRAARARSASSWRK